MKANAGGLVIIVFGILAVFGVLGYYLLRDLKRRRQMIAAAQGLGGRKTWKFLKGACVEWMVPDSRNCLMWVQEKNRYIPAMMHLEMAHSLPFTFLIEGKGSIFTRDFAGLIGLGKEKLNLPPALADHLIIHSRDPIKAEFFFNDARRQEAALGLVGSGFVRVDAGKKRVKARQEGFIDNDFDPVRLKQLGDWMAQLTT